MGTVDRCYRNVLEPLTVMVACKAFGVPFIDHLPHVFLSGLLRKRLWFLFFGNVRPFTSHAVWLPDGRASAGPRLPSLVLFFLHTHRPALNIGLMAATVAGGPVRGPRAGESRLLTLSPMRFPPPRRTDPPSVTAFCVHMARLWDSGT